MKSVGPQSALDDPRVLDAAREYLGELEAGRKPDRQAYFSRHPELKDDLSKCFNNIDMAHGAARVLGDMGTPQPEQVFGTIGDFQIVREIGRGGMGVVYEAMQISLNRRVALKVLPFAAAMDERQLRRFRTEAQAAAQLHHTTIVPVHAVGCERGVHFYAMQFIDGRSLDSVIKGSRGDSSNTHGGTTVDLLAGGTAGSNVSSRTVSRTSRGRENHRSAARIAANVAEALEYAHEAGVIHRDIKPANLLMDSNGMVWVTDFGLAQITADAGVTQTGDIFGTLRYMSPEQASGQREQVDRRTDVYSLGATLYELLTLEPIFAAKDRRALLHQILNEEPRPPRQIDRTIPVELETIVLKAVAKAPADRYPTAAEMCADLRRYLEQRPILARRPSVIDRAHKWLRRHPSVVVAAMLVLIFSVIVLGVSTAMIAQEQAKTKSINDQLNLTLEKEKQRAKEAEERFKLAKSAADEMIRMAQDELRLNNDPQMQALRKSLLESAIAFYQEFIELRRYDPDVQTELETTRDQVKQILDDLVVMQGAGQFFLLKSPVVQRELHLTDDQQSNIAQLTKKLDSQRDDCFEGPKMSPDELNKRLLNLARMNDAAVSEFLSKEQRARFGQIAFQCMGSRAFHDAGVIRELKLTNEQREQIRGIEMAYFNNFEPHGLGPPMGPKKGPKMPSSSSKKDTGRKEPKRDRDDRDPWDRREGLDQKEFERKLKAAVEKIEAILGADQLQKWKEMTGEPIQGPLPSMQPPRRDGGPPPGGPGGPAGGGQPFGPFRPTNSR